MGANGVQEIKDHPFFADIDWQMVLEKKLTPPYIPRNRDEKNMKKEEEEADDPKKDIQNKRHRRNRSVDAFEGFSFTRTEGEANASEKRKLKKFDTSSKLLKSKKLGLPSRSSSVCTDLSPNPVIKPQEEPTPSKAKRVRGHRRARSQTVADVDIDVALMTPNTTVEAATPAKKAKLARLASVKIGRFK